MWEIWQIRQRLLWVPGSWVGSVGGEKVYAQTPPAALQLHHINPTYSARAHQIKGRCIIPRMHVATETVSQGQPAPGNVSIYMVRLQLSAICICYLRFTIAAQRLRRSTTPRKASTGRRSQWEGCAG